MKLIYKGEFDGNTEALPGREHLPGATKFKEFDNPTSMAIFANVTALVLTIGLVAVVFVYGNMKFDFSITIGALLSMVTIFPHEILHAICFRGEVHLYTNWSKGMCFVVGTETMSKGRFVFMSLLPNLIFGFLPFILFFIMPHFCILGVFGAMCIAMGVGDYYNVFNALTQMPKGARTYLYKFNSYWYMP